MTLRGEHFLSFRAEVRTGQGERAWEFPFHLLISLSVFQFQVFFMQLYACIQGKTMTEKQSEMVTKIPSLLHWLVCRFWKENLFSTSVSNRFFGPNLWIYIWSSNCQNKSYVMVTTDAVIHRSLEIIAWSNLVPVAFCYSFLANFATRTASVNFLLARSFLFSRLGASISASHRKFPNRKR